MGKMKLLLTGFAVMSVLISCEQPPLSTPTTTPLDHTSITQEATVEFTEEVTPIPPYEPSVENQQLVNFEFCGNMGSTGGTEPGNSLANKCVSLPEREGKVTELNYQTPNGWAAYWIKLNITDFTPYDQLVFFAKAVPSEGSLQGFKIEFWGTDHTQHTIYTKAKLATGWQKYEIPLADFECLPNELCINWADIEELVFSFETERSGKKGTVYLADIYIERHESGMPTPEAVSPEPLLIANFDNGLKTLLGGETGVACPKDGCPSPNKIIATYVFEDGNLKLEYAISEWAAFWMKLQKSDLSEYSKLRFDIRAEPGLSSSREIKVELKRGNEIGISYFSGVTEEFQTRELILAEFRNPGFGEVLSGWTDMDELVFTFEASKSGGGGIIYLDNIEFVP